MFRLQPTFESAANTAKRSGLKQHVNKSYFTFYTGLFDPGLGGCSAFENEHPE